MTTNNRMQLNTVDQLAIVKSQIAQLQEQEKCLKQELIDSGLPTVEGMLHRASVSLTTGKEVIDWAAIAAKFEPSRQLVTAHTRVLEPFYTVRVVAKKTS